MGRNPDRSFHDGAVLFVFLFPHVSLEPDESPLYGLSAFKVHGGTLCVKFQLVLVRTSKNPSYRQNPYSAEIFCI